MQKCNEEIEQLTAQHKEELHKQMKIADDLRTQMRVVFEERDRMESERTNADRRQEALVRELRTAQGGSLYGQTQQVAALRSRLDGALEELTRHQAEADRRQTETAEQRAAVRALKDELAAAQEAHTREVQRAGQAQEAELQQVRVPVFCVSCISRGQVHARVRQAVAKKDEQIAQLREQLRIATNRLQQTEETLSARTAALLLSPPPAGQRR